MGLKLYATITSPPVRAVLLCAKALEVDLEWKQIDPFKAEHLQPEYLKGIREKNGLSNCEKICRAFYLILKFPYPRTYDLSFSVKAEINPQHTIPVLDDDGFTIVDSHAIITYLVSKYGKDDSLYPRDFKLRAIIDHRLHFDSSILFTRGAAITRGLIFEGEKEISKKQLLALEEAFHITEKLLNGHNYVAGDHLTVADFSIVTSLTSWSIYIPVTEARFPKISAWLRRLQSLPYYEEANEKGLNLIIEGLSKYLPK